MNSIIFVTVSMGGGGTERVISVLANNFCQRNIKVTIMTIADDRIAYDLDNRIEVLNISKATGGNFSARIKRITTMRRHFLQSKESGVIAMGTVASIFTLLALWGMKNPCVISERNDPNRLNHKPIRREMRWLRNFLYRHTKGIVFQTEDARNCFPVALRNKSVVIPNPISNLISDVSINNKRNCTIISAGRLTEQKNHKLLINAFRKFYLSYPYYKLIIYGKGELETELRDYIDSIGMKQNIFMPGYSDNLYDQLKNGAMYVSCSNWEGISNSLMEALAFGIPTIATDCPMGGSRMLIRNGENGLLISMNDEDALINAMKKIAENPEFAEYLSHNAVDIRNELNEERISDMWIQVMMKG